MSRPVLWRLFRAPLRRQFERLAPVWESRRGPEVVAPLLAALDRLDERPRRVLDLGTGTGKGARIVAERYPEADVTGIDLAPAMIAEAERLLPGELRERVRFRVADAAELPFEDAEFDLVLLLNMIPFFRELARVTSPGGVVVLTFSSGPRTPIFVPTDTLRAGLGRVGFQEFEELSVGSGTAFFARRSA